MVAGKPLELVQQLWISGIGSKVEGCGLYGVLETPANRFLGLQDCAMRVTACSGERSVDSGLRRRRTATFGSPDLLSSFSLGLIGRESSLAGCLRDDPIGIGLRVLDEGPAHGLERGS